MGCDLPVAVGSNLRHEFDLCNLPFPRWDLPSYSCGTRNRDPSEVAGHHFLVHSIDMFLLLFLRKTFQWMLLHDEPFFNFLRVFLFSFFFCFQWELKSECFFSFFICRGNSILRVFNKEEKGVNIYIINAFVMRNLHVHSRKILCTVVPLCGASGLPPLLMGKCRCVR